MRVFEHLLATARDKIRQKKKSPPRHLARSDIEYLAAVSKKGMLIMILTCLIVKTNLK
jgi:hypothetical protein